MQILNRIAEPKITKTSWRGKCRRCGGQVYIDHDEVCAFEKCLQCGNEVNIFAPETKRDWDILAKNLNGNYGETLPDDCKAEKYQRELDLDKLQEVKI